MQITSSHVPADFATGHFCARIMTSDGPCVIGFAQGEAFDLTPAFGTASRFLEEDDAIGAMTRRGQPVSLDLAALLANAAWNARDAAKPYLLSPIDLQTVKAAGVTYVRSMLERVVEERCRGDATQAEAVRAEFRAIIGDDLTAIIPGSAEAMRLKAALLAKGWWSQYLEVGIGPDAEIFTKAPCLSAVGWGSEVGIHPQSEWNNPEPEIVLAVNSRGETVGASLGNDVNLRDFEGRSALLLGKAKDNNASAAIGPMIRLFDDSFSLDDVRQMTLTLTVTGLDGFTLQGSSSMAEISRDPADLAAQTMGRHHQYPDGFMLYCGTMFSPVQDRDGPGQGFTHHLGDVVTIETPALGSLTNTVRLSTQAPEWTFGTAALMRNLAGRGFL